MFWQLNSNSHLDDHLPTVHPVVEQAQHWPDTQPWTEESDNDAEETKMEVTSSVVPHGNSGLTVEEAATQWNIPDVFIEDVLDKRQGVAAIQEVCLPRLPRFWHHPMPSTKTQSATSVPRFWHHHMLSTQSVTI